MKRIIPLVIGGAIFMFSCATEPIIYSPLDYYDRTRVSVDSYKKIAWVIGPKVFVEYGTTYFMRAYLGRKNIFYQIYVVSYSRNWQFYNEAYDQYGNSFEVIEIDKDIDVSGTSVSVKEVFAIMLSREYLEKYKDEGLHLKIYGKKKDLYIDVDSNYLYGFLRKVDDWSLKDEN